PPNSSVLLIRLRSIGDVILLTPALRLLKEWRPDLRITVVVENRFRELLENNPDIEELIDLGRGSGVAKIAGRVRVMREIRRRRFALCINLHGGPTGTLLTRGCGAKYKVGFDYYRSKGIYTVLIPDTKQILGRRDVHTTEHQAAIFFHLGMPRSEIPRAQLYLTPQQREWWNSKRASLGISADREYAIVQPTALYATKQWSAANFARLGESLEREAGLLPVFSCGPNEEGLLDAAERAVGKKIVRLEGTRLGEFAAALEGARIFIGNDSGPAHMAAALARPVVVIFASSSSVIWGPWPRATAGTSSRIVQNHFDCNPCPGDRCYQFARPECILSVTFEQVWTAVEEVLRSTALSYRKLS
ncbi:MAG: glycosyltransferase family 9 protein, partial [Deltaproteobacteria bacterium]